MATGPQHFAEAQRLLAFCAGDKRGSDLDKACTAAAQVHATLANAAAVLYPYCDNDKAEAEYQEWLKAMGSS